MTDTVNLNANTTTDLAYWIPEIWSKLVYEEAKAQMYWNRFSGPEGSGMPVIVKTELLTEPGDIIHISQVANITGGVTGESVLRGNESKLTLAEVLVTPEWNRHAVAVTGKAKKQITQDFRMKATSALSYWLAKTMDTSMWTAARLTTSQGFESDTISVIYGGDAESVDGLDSSDTFGMEEIRKAAAVLEGNDIARVSVPGMPAGEGYYLCFIHPYQAYSLKADDEWIENARNAGVRGNDNQLFTGSIGEVDGVIVHVTTQASVADNANSPVIGTSRAVMVGREALCRGMNEDITWSEQENDYRFEQGISVAAAFEDKVLSQAAIVQIATAAINPSA